MNAAMSKRWTGEAETRSSQLERLTSQQPGEEPLPPAGTHGDYAAVQIVPESMMRRARLRIIYGNGFVGLMDYSYEPEILLTSPQRITLFFTRAAITLEGRHLDLLLDDLQRNRLWSIVCYNQRRHRAPLPDMPVITRITRLPLAARLATSCWLSRPFDSTLALFESFQAA